MNHEEQISLIVENVKKMKVSNIYLVGCGGSMAALSPGEYFFDREIDAPVKIYSSNEFVHRTPKLLNENSIVITRSHSGTTPETIEATKLAAKAGAMTIAITMDMDSGLANEATYKVHYDYSKTEKIDAYEGEYGVLYRLYFSLMNVFNPNEKYIRVIEQIKNLQNLFDTNKNLFKEAADKFGKEQKRAENIYTMASGAYYPFAYSFSSCLLMEMMWVHSNPIHAGEYFHGPFEITDFDVPFLIIRGNGETQAIDDRAISFVNKYSKNVYVIDVNEFNFSNIDKDLESYFGVMIIGTVMRMYADALSDYKGHPLSVRRYMWRMEY